MTEPRSNDAAAPMRPEPVTLTCADGQRLQGHFFAARGDAASTGWFGGMRFAFALKARLGLNVLVPIGTLLKGYAPTSWLGLGENLPAQVARQWGQWCTAGGYATNAVRAGLADDFHA